MPTCSRTGCRVPRRLDSLHGSFLPVTVHNAKCMVMSQCFVHFLSCGCDFSQAMSSLFFLQMTFGISRDDAQARFLTHYIRHGLLPSDPFETIDEAGVGELVRTAVQRGREARPNLSLGICGEHGGDPLSIDFFHRIGLDYVSCSPLRVPIARLAAAQAVVREKQALAK